MIYLGIVGVLSPLGKKVIDELQDCAEDYKVVWTVDEGYDSDDSQKSQFRDLKSVLIGGFKPTVVLDFGPTAGLLERAKTYRRHNVAAIMQGSLTEQQIGFLNEFGKESYVGHRAPLMLEPEFSLVKTQLVKNLLSQSCHLITEIRRIEITIRHHAENKDVTLPWYYWMHLVNEMYKENVSSEQTSVPVQLNDYFEEFLEPDEETLHIKLILNDDNGCLEWKLTCPLLESRVDGVFLMLEWYLTERDNAFDLVMGNMVVDILPSLI